MQATTAHPECADVLLDRACACCDGLGPGVDINSNGCIDLLGADLRGTDLDSAKLDGADLSCASFECVA